jgi:hypothetical protein
MLMRDGGFPMRRWMFVLALLLAHPAASAPRMDCQDWERLSPAEKPASVQEMIERHLSSDKRKRFTDTNPVNLRRCLEANLQSIIDDVDGACAESNRSQDPVDDTFDGYLMSCVR